MVHIQEYNAKLLNTSLLIGIYLLDVIHFQWWDGGCEGEADTTSEIRNI